MAYILNINKELISQISNEKVETLSDDTLSFTGEVEAMYFSDLKEGMKSDIAYEVMHSNQDISDLEVIKILRESGYSI